METSGSLRRPLSTFVGRRREMAELTGLLATNRLVTLVGPGGVGKTRMALELAAQTQPDSERSSLLVDLASVQSQGMVAAQIAVVAGVTEVAGEELLDTVAGRLSGDRVMMVLDNCEHLLGEAAFAVERLLQECGRMTVLATSRHPLGVPGEVAWRVPPLGLPQGEGPGAAAVAGFDAVKLFVDRAAAALTGYRLSDHSAAPVAEICRRLDGMPLAIELVSPWVGVLGETEILDRISRDLKLLGGGSSSLPERHRTIEAAIRWSCSLLEPADLHVFRRLSIFAGAFSLEAAEAVTRDPAILQRLATLVSHSLVVAETDPQRPASYRLLQTIRRFGRSALESDSGAAETAGRHAAYFEDLAEQAEAVRDTPEATRWLARLSMHRDDLRAALEWLVSTDPERAVRLAGALGWFWQTAGSTEGSAWFSRVLGNQTTPDRFRARAEDWAGWLAMHRQDFQTARLLIQNSHDISAAIGDQAGVARALTGLGPIVRISGDPLLGRRMVTEALDLARRTGDTRIEGGALTTLGIFALDENDGESATSLLEEALDVVRGSGNLPAIAMATVFLAVALLRGGEVRQAMEPLQEALDISEQLGDMAGMAMVLELIALAEGPSDLAGRARLFAAGQTILEREGVGRPPYWLEDLRAWRVQARSKLGSKADQIWEEGRSMAFQEVLGLAPRGPGRGG
ncbi:MAG: AAA family ATPase, partial [Actinomycetota bacterium]